MQNTIVERLKNENQWAATDSHVQKHSSVAQLNSRSQFCTIIASDIHETRVYALKQKFSLQQYLGILSSTTLLVNKSSKKIQPVPHFYFANVTQLLVSSRILCKGVMGSIDFSLPFSVVQADGMNHRHKQMLQK